MKKIKFTLTLIFTYIIITNLLAQTNPTNDPLYGAYGFKDIRVQAPFGAINDSKYKKFTKLNNLNEKRIGFVLLIPEEVGLSEKPIFPRKTPLSNLNFGLQNFADSLLISSLSTLQKKGPTIIKINPNFLQDKIKTNNWDGTIHIPLNENRQILEELRTNNDIEILLIIIGGGFRDFIKGTQLPFESQGLFKQGNNYIYAGHRIALIDLKTGKTIPNGFSIQASADYSVLDFKKNFSDYSNSELLILKKETKERIRNNIVETVKILGLN